MMNLCHGMNQLLKIILFLGILQCMIEGFMGLIRNFKGMMGQDQRLVAAASQKLYIFTSHNAGAPGREKDESNDNKSPQK